MTEKKKPATKPVELSEAPVVAETPAPAVEAVPEAPKAAETPCCVRAKAGDNYLTIAERYGLDAHALVELNGGNPILTGTKVHLR